MLDPKLVGHETHQDFLSLIHFRCAVGTGQDHMAFRHPGTLAHKVLAELRGHMLQGVEGSNHVKAVVEERQCAATTEHQVLFIRSLHVHQLDTVVGQELAQQGSATAHIKNPQGLFPRAYTLHQIRHQLVPLVLVEWQS